MIEETIEMIIVIAATENADAVSKNQIKKWRIPKGSGLSGFFLLSII
jgi:hypothetical protein